MNEQNPSLILVYDGLCPACNQYVQWARVRESCGEIRLIDARSGDPLIDEVVPYNVSLDDGMLLKLGDRVYHAEAAVHMMALLSTRHGLFNRLNYLIFRSGWRARFFYPLLKWFRSLLLWLCGAGRIDGAGS
jgi:predicted DCC family thiol-disulfide oxidoreductase YuxK